MAGQTLSEIRALLAGAALSPRQRYGQHFLIDLNLMRKLVAAGELQPADVVLEVGCGTGSLTELLLETGGRAVGVEIDRGLRRILADRLGAHPRFTLIAGDVLSRKHQLNPLVAEALRRQVPDAGGHYKLVANLPYDVATPLLMELLYGTPPFERLVCTIQKEVGQRLTAPPATEHYGPLSVIAQTLAETRVLATLPPAVFWPPPRVESVMLALRPRPAERVLVGDVRGFVNFVRTAFLHRRKMLRSAARDWGAEDLTAAMERAGVAPSARPESLSPADWQALFAARAGARSPPPSC